MIWKDLGSSLALTRRRRAVATALMYGLTLTVRFTSAAGDEADTPARAVQGSDPITSIMINDGTPILAGDWLPGPAQLTAFRRGASLSSRGCLVACERPARMPFVTGCVSRQ